MRFFITGTAGFIGFHLARRLLQDGHSVFGFDGMTTYYDVTLKAARLDILRGFSDYHHVEARLEDFDAVLKAATESEASTFVHLAAQAGVRYSLENPRAYVDSNLVGTFNVLEAARILKPDHLMLASSSSVYGANTKIPFAETDKTDEPLTLYAASKKSMEVMAHAYAHLWKIPTTCFRFFTVYGPYGRPDMAPIKFAEAALKDEAIEVYGEGKQSRDFTYIDDLVDAIVRLVPLAPNERNRQSADKNETLSQQGPYRVINLGGGQPIGLMDFITAIEEALGQTVKKIMRPMQKGDVPRTYAAPDLLQALTHFKPATTMKDGAKAFVDWYKDYIANFK